MGACLHTLNLRDLDRATGRLGKGYDGLSGRPWTACTHRLGLAGLSDIQLLDKCIGSSPTEQNNWVKQGRQASQVTVRLFKTLETHVKLIVKYFEGLSVLISVDIGDFFGQK